MPHRIHYKTVIISDLHLGTPDAKIDQLMDFLKNITYDKIILNGDIFDVWHIRLSSKWIRKHTKFARLILKKIEEGKVEVVYIRGNHDDMLESFLPFKTDNLEIVNEYVHETEKGKYLVIHGDGFDIVSIYYKWLEVLGSVGYITLLRINRYYNYYRRWRGKEYFSLSKRIKQRVKRKVSEISNLEQELEKISKKKGCTGVICGHTHIPEDKMIGSVHYLNSGDWVELMTALVEEEDGTIRLIEYEDFKNAINLLKKSDS